MKFERLTGVARARFEILFHLHSYIRQTQQVQPPLMVALAGLYNTLKGGASGSDV